MAPTEIIFEIATNYIFGFDPDGKITRKNFKKADALRFSQEGTLPEMLDKLFGSDMEGA